MYLNISRDKREKNTLEFKAFADGNKKGNTTPELLLSEILTG